MLRCFTAPCNMSSWYTWTPVSPLSCKNECHPMMGHPTKPWRRKGDGLPVPSERFPSPHRMFEHKSSGSCTAQFRRFSRPGRGCFRTHSQCSTALVNRIAFRAGLKMCLYERSCTVMCWSSQMRRDIGSMCSALETWSVSRADFRESTSALFS